MNLSLQIAKHFRGIHFGENWTDSNIRDHLKDITWKQATTQVYDFNTILTLTYHISYYVSAVLKVFQGEPLNAKDIYSFNHPEITSQDDWEQLLENFWNEADSLAKLIENLPKAKLWEDFTDKKYGNYYRNIHGLIEHSHYHLGQIVLIKKLLLQADKS